MTTKTQDPFVSQDPNVQARLIAMGAKGASPDTKVQTQAVSMRSPGVVVGGGVNSDGTQYQAITAVAPPAPAAPAQTLKRYDPQGNVISGKPDAGEGYRAYGQKYSMPLGQEANNPSSPTVLSKTDYLNKYGTGTVDEASIREQIRKENQYRIDSINSAYDQMLRKQNTVNEGNLGSVRAINARAGLMGSDFGQANTMNQQSANEQANRAINLERDARVTAALASVDQLAMDKIEAEKKRLQGEADAYSKYLEQSQAKAQEMIKMLGTSGVSASELKEKQPLEYEKLLNTTGLSDFQLGLQINSIKKAAERIDWKMDRAGDLLIISGVNPITGKIEYHTEKLPADAANNDIKIIDNEIWSVSPDGKSATKLGASQGGTDDIREYEFAKNEGFTGSYTDFLRERANLKTGSSSGFTLNPGDVRYDANGKEIARGLEKKDTSGLDSRTQVQVDALARSFDTNPIVKSFVEVQNKKASIDQIIANGASGPADVAIVYEFMKALDPTSVVRESEYANASKSGNIFLGALAKFNGLFKEEGGTLPENVKKEFAKILSTKYSVVNKQYKNLYDETARKINRKTGDGDGREYLTNYDFDMVENASISPDELQQLREAFPGMSDKDLLDGLQDFNQEQQSSYKGASVIIPASSRLAHVNNNPGNLRFAGQRGARQGEGGFAKFDTPEAGYEALKSQIRLDASRGLTLAGFIRKYAPPNENDTNLYLRQITMATGYSPNDAIRDIDLNTLARAMARKESSTRIA